MENSPAPELLSSAGTPSDADGIAESLIDSQGRRISYLRMSITDRCDFRCTYCMAEEMKFLPRSEVLSLEECLRLVKFFVARGVHKLRITGGEPLVRRDAMWLIERLGALNGLDELVMTTNGSQLERFANQLAAAGVRRLNISLDTLDHERFRRITRIGDLQQVLRGIEAAQRAGFKRIKLNTVMMRGINDEDFLPLTRFAVANDLDLSFIEAMPLGNIPERSAKFISSDETRSQLAKYFELLPTAENSGGPARYWRIPGSNSRIGFISPHSHNFCDSCNRIRITAKGELYPCLGDNGAVSLLPLLRATPDEAALQAAVLGALEHKAPRHDFPQQMDQPQVVRFMSMTGG